MCSYTSAKSFSSWAIWSQFCIGKWHYGHYSEAMKKKLFLKLAAAALAASGCSTVAPPATANDSERDGKMEPFARLTLHKQ